MSSRPEGSLCGFPFPYEQAEDNMGQHRLDKPDTTGAVISSRNPSILPALVCVCVCV